MILTSLRKHLKKRLLILVPSFFLILSSCSVVSESKDNNSIASANTSEPAEQYTVDPEVAAEYERNLTWGERGHFYIHYMRPSAKSISDYDDWGVWIWQKSPKDLEGSLWGAVNEDFLTTVPYPMSRERVKNIGGSGKDIDVFGVVYDIDMTRTDIVGGKTGNPVDYVDAYRVGFLIVNLPSMAGQSKWVSDGGRDIYIYDFQSHWREDGSMHIFLSENYNGNFTYVAGVNKDENLTLKDRTGNYRSNYTRIPDKYPRQYPNTSEALKELGVGYEIFVASFRDSNGDGTGDIRGIIDSLDYLADELKVQCIWMTPVFSCESYHGYDVTDYFSIDYRFGTDDDFKELVQQCQERGIKLILDFVINHTSRNNNWFVNSEKANTSTENHLKRIIKWRDIYHWKYLGDKVSYYDSSAKEYTSINVETHPDWYRDGDSNYFYYSKFGKDMPELNYDNQDTRDLFIEVGNYWLDKGADGFRLDAIKHIYMRDEIEGDQGDIYSSDYVASKVTYDDEQLIYINRPYDYSTNVTKNIEALKEFSFGLKKDHPNAFLIGENLDGYGARIAPYYQALDSQFDFSNYYHIAEWAVNKSSNHTPGSYSVDQENDAYKFYRSESDDSVIGAVNGYPTGHRPDFVNSSFTSNHDLHRVLNHVSPNAVTPRTVVDVTGIPIKDSKHKDVKFNESKVEGNSVEQGKAKVAAAMSLLNGGLGFIYYGDEIGMSSNTDEHIDKYYTPDYEDIWFRQPFKWGDESITTGYTSGTFEIRWDKHNQTLLHSLAQQRGDKTSMLEFYKALCEIKIKFGKSHKYVGCSPIASDIVHWKVTGDDGTFDIYVNTNSSSRGINVSGSKVYYASNNGLECTNHLIQGYSVLVTQE